MRIRKQITLGEWILDKAQKFADSRDMDFSNLIENALKFYIEEELKKQELLFGETRPAQEEELEGVQKVLRELKKSEKQP